MTLENEKKLEAIRAILPQYEEPRRLEHTMNVYRESLWFAKKFKLSEEDTYTVAASSLLHDITKNLPLADALAICEK
jgi:HD superfamily phosphohydrolase YqeK